MAKKFQRRKRNYLINKDLQGKLVLQYLVLALLGTIALGFLFATTSSDHLTISYDNNAIEVGTTTQVLLGELLRNEVIFLLLGGALIILITIVWTHKIAGPLYRFEQTIKAMCNRQLDQTIYLRKGDEGKELGTKINQLNQLLVDDVCKLKACASHLDESKEKLEILELLNSYQLPEETTKPD